MTTLTEYTTSHFPNHVTDQTRGDMTLTSHTVVAHVVGLKDGIELARRVRDGMPDTAVGTSPDSDKACSERALTCTAEESASRVPARRSRGFAGSAWSRGRVWRQTYRTRPRV